MQFADFPLFEPNVFIVQAEEASPQGQWNSRSEVYVWFDDDGSLWLRQQDQLIELAIKSANKRFVELVRRDRLPWQLLKQSGRDFQLVTVLPSSWLSLDKPVQVAVDELIIDELVRRGVLQTADADTAVNWFRDEFIVEAKESWMAVLRAPQSSPGDWQLIGRSWRADLQAEPSGRVIVRRIVRSLAKGVEWCMVNGAFDFVDATVVNHLLTPSARASLDQSIQSNGSYLDLWRKYSEQEWQSSLRQAASVGVLAYSNVEEASDEGGVWRFRVAQAELTQFLDAWKALESDAGLELEASSEHPDWTRKIQDQANTLLSVRRFRGRLLKVPNASGQLLIESRQKRPPEQGYLFVSLAGDRTVQERRLKAREAIESGRRLPQLQFLLQDLPLPTARRERHRALTRHALACFKHGRPTKRQEKAIKVALETPDIALIIGPPGTGKTQVIAALERRISEMGGQETAQHQVLISSFQHDAVENALDRTSIFGLPGVKVGQRSQADSVDLIERWFDETRPKVEAVITGHESEQPYLPLLSQLHVSIAKLRHGQHSPEERRGQLESIIKILNELAIKFGIRLSTQLMDALSDYVAEQPVVMKSSAADSSVLLRKIRGLRVTPNSFADDGQMRLLELVSACEWFEGIPAPLLCRLQQFQSISTLDENSASGLSTLRDELLDSLLDYRPPSIKHRLDERGQSLLQGVEGAMEDRLKVSRLGVAGVLSRYRDAFAMDAMRAKETVLEYAMVVGATCQQAASTHMASLKNLSGIGDQGISFNTVIVDEAARANPLDLFIPMSMAERRIVLVGDHRQLPHLLEPQVEKEVASTHGLSDEQRAAYEESLFERLWRQLKAREADDGFSRVVMLDEQFRMHPVLGDFVSREFYEKEKLDRVRSGRPETAFRDDIPGYEKQVCCWIDVPNSEGDGRESKRGTTSWQRKLEARVVASEAKRLLDECGEDTSIGVITFYSSQRDAIFKELELTGVTYRDAETGDWLVAEAYKKTRNHEERFRVGTVDAFQGKEFDIVMLSVVRSNAVTLPTGAPGDEAFERMANRKYGHLRLSNRMNVAMSRQRSLLIAVGDRAMAQGASAQKAVPALGAFFELCEGERGHVR